MRRLTIHEVLTFEWSRLKELALEVDQEDIAEAYSESQWDLANLWYLEERAQRRRDIMENG